MARDTPLGFPAHTLPYRCGEFTTLSTASGPPALPGVLSVLRIFCFLAPAKSAESSFRKRGICEGNLCWFPSDFQHEPPYAGYEARTRFPASRELRSAIRRNPASPLIKMHFAHGCRYRVLFV